MTRNMKNMKMTAAAAMIAGVAFGTTAYAADNETVDHTEIGSLS